MATNLESNLNVYLTKDRGWLIAGQTDCNYILISRGDMHQLKQGAEWGVLTGSTWPSWGEPFDLHWGSPLLPWGVSCLFPAAKQSPTKGKQEVNWPNSDHGHLLYDSGRDCAIVRTLRRVTLTYISCPPPLPLASNCFTVCVAKQNWPLPILPDLISTSWARYSEVHEQSKWCSLSIRVSEGGITVTTNFTNFENLEWKKYWPIKMKINGPGNQTSMHGNCLTDHYNYTETARLMFAWVSCCIYHFNGWSLSCVVICSTISSKSKLNVNMFGSLVYALWLYAGAEL